MSTRSVDASVNRHRKRIFSEHVLGIAVLVLSTILLQVASAVSICPPDPCSKIRCKELKPEDCPGGYIKPNTTVCACCSACIKLLDIGESCMRKVVIPAVAECKSGLMCSKKSGTCVPPLELSSQLGSSTEEVRTCTEVAAETGKDSPVCSPDGSYAPKQCTDSKCMCVAADGSPLSYVIEREYAGRMQCLCARVEHAQGVQSGRMCDKYGNYRSRRGFYGRSRKRFLAI